jgi:hypothetical protein
MKLWEIREMKKVEETLRRTDLKKIEQEYLKAYLRSLIYNENTMQSV